MAKKKVAQPGSAALSKAAVNAKPLNIGLFFGAGAEISYGLPSGGRFAIEIFRRSSDAQKARFKELLGSISLKTTYAADYLPPEFQQKKLNVFGKPDFTSLLQSSIEYRRGQVLEFLNSFDTHAAAAIKATALKNQQFEKLYAKVMGQEFGTSNYQSAIRLNDRFGNDNKLFASSYFSAFLDILTKFKDERLLRRCLTSFLQLLVGCRGQQLTEELNEQLFSEVPKDLPIFDDIGGVFQIEFSQAGLSALEIVLDERPIELTPESSLATIASELCRGTLERVFEGCLDYQSLLDSHFRYVYDPKASWAKFTKICIFLNVVRDYILESLPAMDEIREKYDGYYHDLLILPGLGLTAKRVGSTNYNKLIENICGKAAPQVDYLNGSVTDFYDPYLNRIIHLDDADEQYTKQKHVLVPMLFTQSGIKPLTSIEMSRRYVEMYDHFKACDAVVVIGFGFNGDDGHINGLFRELILTEGKQVYICSYTRGEFNEAAVRIEYRKKLRLETNPENLHFISVDNDRRTSEGGPMWYEALARSMRLK